MDFFPAVQGKTVDRPGRYRHSKNNIQIPDQENNSSFWNDFYHNLEITNLFQYPIPEIEDRINPYFGYYGFRFHPVSYKPSYFNIGIDISSDPRIPIMPISDGVLEYSGFGIINGNYLVLSHPRFVTEDGYRLFSLYMHNRQNNLKFNSYQKMLRQISLNSYPEISIKSDQIIAEVGDTGNFSGLAPTLHLQTILVNKKNHSIALDPCRVLGVKAKKNKTADVKTHQEFIQIFRKYKKNIIDWKIEKFWTSKIMNL